jgi:aryl-alcohol dehydrogenase-like predicted oxidoreductase
MSGGGEVGRRRFLRALLGTGALAAVPHRASPAAPTAAGPAPPRGGMPTRPFGRTGYQVSLLGLGGQATLEKSSRRDEALAILHRALDLGVSYVDTASFYGGGASELAVGEVMRTRRAEVFLATKTHDRSYDGSMRLLETSLRRLRTDRIDLWQLHNVRTETDLDFVFSREGAVRALERARAERVVRFAGVTGHQDPHVLRRAIERYPFDAALLALNAADRHDASFVDHVLPTAVAKGLAVVAMKVPAGGRLLRPRGPLTMEQAMRYALTLPVSTAIVGVSTLAELEEDVAIARSFRPCSPDELAQLERLTRPHHADALWYRRGH